MNQSGQNFLSPDLQRTQRPSHEADKYDVEVLEASVRKSYIFKLAEKGGKKKQKDENFSIKEEQQKGGMLRSTIKPNKLMFEKEKNQTEDRHYEVLLSNIGKPTQTKMNCCKPGFEMKTPVKVTVTPQKQIWIHDIQGQLVYSLNLNTLSVEYSQDNEHKQFILKVKEDLYLKFERDEKTLLFDRFRKDVKNAVEKGMGRMYEMRGLLEKEGFEKRKYKPVTEFTEHCQTGDILLFQGSHFFANVQRFITNSEYDHVGMVIRDPVYGILIFQSNSTSGVCLTPWDLLMKYKWYKYIERIVWRKLIEIKRDKPFINLVHEFVNANIGKNYFISINKLISNQSFVAQNRQEIGFYCSELIAVLYKDLKLLTRNQNNEDYIPSSRIVPLHFTQRYKLPLLMGELSDQFIIHFDDKEIQENYTF